MASTNHTGPLSWEEEEKLMLWVGYAVPTTDNITGRQDVPGNLQ